MIKTVEEAIELITEITNLIDSSNDSKTDDLKTFLHQQEKEKQELKAELGKWKPKVNVGNTGYYFIPNGIQSGIVTEIQRYNWDDDVSKNDDVITAYIINDRFINPKNIFATREEIEDIENRLEEYKTLMYGDFILSSNDKLEAEASQGKDDLHNETMLKDGMR